MAAEALSSDAPPDVRTRILEAAWRLIGDRQDASVPLSDIAHEAGVSRQTVYVNFGNRVGLLRAMVEHRDATSPELARMKRVRREQPTQEVLEAMVRGWFKYVPVIFRVAHSLSSAAATDPDAAEAWASRMEQLRGGLRAMMERLKAEGQLAPGWTPAAAADWCYHQIHVDTWHHLVVERQWRPADVVEATVASLKATLLAKP